VGFFVLAKRNAKFPGKKDNRMVSEPGSQYQFQQANSLLIRKKLILNKKFSCVEGMSYIASVTTPD